MHDFLLQSLQSLICKTMYEDIFSTKINFRTNIKQLLQSNLSIVDMIYSRHLVILDNFFGEQTESWSNSRRKIPNLYGGHLYSGNNFSASREKFKPNLPLYSGHSIFFSDKIKIYCYSIFKCFYLAHFSTFRISELFNFYN